MVKITRSSVGVVCALAILPISIVGCGGKEAALMPTAPLSRPRSRRHRNLLQNNRPQPYPVSPTCPLEFEAFVGSDCGGRVWTRLVRSKSICWRYSPARIQTRLFDGSDRCEEIDSNRRRSFALHAARNCGDLNRVHANRHRWKKGLTRKSGSAPATGACHIRQILTHTVDIRRVTQTRECRRGVRALIPHQSRSAVGHVDRSGRARWR